MQDNKKAISIIMLLITTIIWGSAFVAQDIGSNYVSSFTFNCVRFFLSFIIMLPIAIYRQKKLRKESKQNSLKEIIISSLICGTCLILASILQQEGISTQGAGKSGFITSMYLVIIPIFYFVFRHKRYSFNVYVGVLLALIGLYFLSVKGDFTLEKGDIFLIGSAFMFAAQIISCGYFAQNMDPFTLSCGQSLVSFIISLIPTIVIDKPEFSQIANALPAVLYVSVFSTCVAYTLQIIAQKHLNSTLASLLMSLESVFSAIFGAIILKDYLDLKEYIACALIFAGVIFSQITFCKKKKIEVLDEESNALKEDDNKEDY